MQFFSPLSQMDNPACDAGRSFSLLLFGSRDAVETACVSCCSSFSISDLLSKALRDGLRSNMRQITVVGATTKARSTPNTRNISFFGSLPRFLFFRPRYPQLCEFMGATPEAVKGFTPKHHPPAKTLRLCEEILDELRKAEEQTAAGGTRALRNATRAAAGETVGKVCDAL